MGDERFLRDSEDNDVYGVNGVPEYCNKEYFTVKFIHGGHFEESPHKQYMGGTYNYFDYCHPDYISLLDIINMGKELGYRVGHLKFQYKSPSTDMDKGLWELEKDDDVLTMCMLIPPSRLIEIYLEVIRPVVGDVDFEVEGNNNNECRDDMMSVEDYENESTDESYVDSSVDGAEGDQTGGAEDDAVGDEGATVTQKGKQKCSEKGKRFATNQRMGKQTAETQTGLEEPHTSSEYDDSDVERMPRVDEFDPEPPEEYKEYPEFSKTNIEDPEFELGMTFSNVTEVRAAIRNHGIKQGKVMASKWDPTGIEPPLPPVKHTPVGRPKVIRRKSNDIPDSNPEGTILKRKGTSLTCGFCKEWGHNSRRCPQKLNKQPDVISQSSQATQSQYSQPPPNPKRAKKVQNTSQASQPPPMTPTDESTMQPGGMSEDQEQAGGSTKWQGGIHYEGSQRNEDADILQPKDYTWKGKQCTTLRDLEAAARSKREKIQSRKPTDAKGHTAEN